MRGSGAARLSLAVVFARRGPPGCEAARHVDALAESLSLQWVAHRGQARVGGAATRREIGLSSNVITKWDIMLKISAGRRGAAHSRSPLIPAKAGT
jgi:hypothetical protein